MMPARLIHDTVDFRAATPAFATVNRMRPMTEIPELDPRTPGPSRFVLACDAAFAGLIAHTYLKLVGTSLLPEGLDPDAAARWMYQDAPFCLLVHNTAADPRFIYANRAAQACFGFTWAEMTQLASRQSAEAPDQADRDRLIEAVRRAGFATGYRGLRIAKSGRRFWIENVTMWQVAEPGGRVCAEAAVYSQWRDA